MNKRVTVGYFLEDIAQDRFIRAITERVAVDVGFHEHSISHHVRNATHGASAALRELGRYLHDVVAGQQERYDILVVAIDGNCSGSPKKRQEIENVAEKAGFHGSVVCAVPEPHIERWYLLDPAACQRAIGLDIAPVCPPYKCEKQRYKTALTAALRGSGITSILGGSEYGAAIAFELEFYALEKADTGFKTFVSDLRNALKSAQASA